MMECRQHPSVQSSFNQYVSSLLLCVQGGHHPSGTRSFYWQPIFLEEDFVRFA